VTALQEMGVVNGVILLDEIDKLGETEHGLQVQYSLLHSIDPAQNSHFVDHYLGPQLPLDLSKTLIICAMNSTSKLDPALLNRLCIIKIPDYTSTQKIKILRKHLFPDALIEAGLTTEQIVLTQEGCDAIVSQVEQRVGKEGGVRGIKNCIKAVIDKIGLLIRTNEKEQEALQLSFSLDTATLPVPITANVVAELYKNDGSPQSWTGMFL